MITGCHQQLAAANGIDGDRLERVNTFARFRVAFRCREVYIVDLSTVVPRRGMATGLALPVSKPPAPRHRRRRWSRRSSGKAAGRARNGRLTKSLSRPVVQRSVMPSVGSGRQIAAEPVLARGSRRFGASRTAAAGWGSRLPYRAIHHVRRLSSARTRSAHAEIADRDA